ncbi:diguanylate cyclase domain-containing protein [Geodermatophilus sp. SYSU D00691]
MSTGRSVAGVRGEIPRVLRWLLPFALLGLAVAVPSSAPDGTGMQWDELVLGTVAGVSAWSVLRRTRTLVGAAARPWQLIGVACACFSVAQFLAGSFPGPEFDGFGVDDVLVFLGATAPLVTSAMLVRRVSRTRWTTLAVDGAMATAALFAVTEMLREPASAGGAPDEVGSLVLAYGGYAAVMIGVGSALCTVSTAALRRSVTAMAFTVALQAAAALFEAAAIVSPAPAWTACADLAVASALLATTLAAHRAPDRYGEASARESAARVSPVGLGLLLTAIGSLPVSLVVGVAGGEPLRAEAQLGLAAVFGLLVCRLVLRVREETRLSEDLLRSEERLAELVEATSDGVVIVDADLRLLFASPLARTLLGIGPDDAEPHVLPALFDDPATAADALADTTTRGLHVSVSRDRRRELEVDHAELEPTPGRRVLYLRDVTSRRARERELERMAFTDHLTGLPNRAQLFQEMAEPAGGPRALLVLDLDGFKAVNDLAGHEAGDQLLVETARRLHTAVREGDLVARLGGDEFAVVVEGTLEEATDVAQRVVDALSLPHRTGERSFAVGASVGVAELGSAGGQVAFRTADEALRAAKQAGKGCVRVAGRDAHRGTLDLAAAIEADEIELRFAGSTTADGRIAQVHAGPVWVHPTHGRVPSQDLWAAAEREGLVTLMQLEGLNRACAAVAALDGVDLVLSLPTGQVSGPGLVVAVTEALRVSGLAASRLVLMVTEETLLTGQADLLPGLETVRDLGVRLCIADYGMGHSLFALLARVGLDAVRVDVAQLAGRDDRERALQVFAAIVRTAEAFGLQTVADGVDTPELRDAVLAAGADLVTGRIAPADLTAAEVAARLTSPAAVR